MKYKGWFSGRSYIYREIAKRGDLKVKLDSVFVHYSSPEAMQIDMNIFVNGQKRLTCLCSGVYDPFADIKTWLEDIVLMEKMETTMKIATKGNEYYLHYEQLLDAEFLEWKLGNTLKGESHYNIGLFYVYDSATDSIPFYAICDTGEFVLTNYLALLTLSGSLYNGAQSDFKANWYNYENIWKRGRNLDNFSFYNGIKSPIIEWNMLSTCKTSGIQPYHFQKTPQIKEAISMWSDYDGGLFWRQDSQSNANRCCGNVQSISTKTAGEISLTSIEGLTDWYKEYDVIDLTAQRSFKKWSDWLNRGYELAFQIRKLLPDTIDLFYQYWFPHIKVNDGKIRDYYQMIVLNENSLTHSFRKQLGGYFPTYRFNTKKILEIFDR